MVAVTQELSRHGIGGSGAAAALGFNPWKPPIVLYRELRGEIPPQPDNPAMAWGRLLEAPIRQRYADRHGVAIEVPRESIFHPELDFARATPDGFPLAAGEWDRILEIKWSGAYSSHLWGKPGTDEIMEPYLVQAQDYMWITGLSRCDFAVLHGHFDTDVPALLDRMTLVIDRLGPEAVNVLEALGTYQEYAVERNDEFIENVLEPGLREFWRRVQDGDPPPPDASPEYAAYLAERYPMTRAGLVAPTDEVRLKAESLRIIRQELKEAKEAEALLKNELRAFAGEHRGIDLGDGERITWTKVERSGYTVAPSTHERINIPKQWSTK